MYSQAHFIRYGGFKARRIYILSSRLLPCLKLNALGYSNGRRLKVMQSLQNKPLSIARACYTLKILMGSALFRVRADRNGKNGGWKISARSAAGKTRVARHTVLKTAKSAAAAGHPVKAAKDSKKGADIKRRARSNIPAKTEKLKARERRAREKALLKEAFALHAANNAAGLEERRAKLRALIKLGKERSFLTHAEINDHLPEDIVETEAIDTIIGTFSDMGIAVVDQAPDAEALLLNDNAPAATSDDEVEEAEVALTHVDSEFGRTTDPVRMYMREMGSIELLNRESEIEIAKRIEDGLKHMIQAISACPTTIAQILELAAHVKQDQLRIEELVDGLIDLEEDADGFSADFSEDENEDDEEAAERANAAQLAELKRVSLDRFTRVGRWFDKMRRAYEKEGYQSKAYLKAQKTIQNA